ncbi:hypothetical protein N7466_008613 [Penicillium verhagenii]|uniref:uncharacterized protein n=1 Tax=Penicillium verhagenii TaxID=1562060 RepID=UPI0025452597|nr:uncharacterized protein N7466_008613 [Penicillium verhagenii]KAJ5924426.1 hypothetical protein N7466_008613 [Penicillium verhagenii]
MMVFNAPISFTCDVSHISRSLTLFFKVCKMPQEAPADTAGPSSPPPRMPEGWLPQWEGVQRKWYYVQRATGKSQWDIPTEPVVLTPSTTPTSIGTGPSLAPPSRPSTNSPQVTGLTSTLAERIEAAAASARISSSLDTQLNGQAANASLGYAEKSGWYQDQAIQNPGHTYVQNAPLAESGDYIFIITMEYRETQASDHQATGLRDMRVGTINNIKTFIAIWLWALSHCIRWKHTVPLYLSPKAKLQVSVLINPRLSLNGGWSNNLLTKTLHITPSPQILAPPIHRGQVQDMSRIQHHKQAVGHLEISRRGHHNHPSTRIQEQLGNDLISPGNLQTHGYPQQPIPSHAQYASTNMASSQTGTGFNSMVFPPAPEPHNIGQFYQNPLAQASLHQYLPQQQSIDPGGNITGAGYPHKYLQSSGQYNQWPNADSHMSRISASDPQFVSGPWGSTPPTSGPPPPTRYQ